MNVQKFIAAAAVFVAAGSAFAADAPIAASLAAPVAAAAVASNLNLPTVTVTTSGQSRADVHAQAVEFVKHYKTALTVQLEQSRN